MLTLLWQGIRTHAFGTEHTFGHEAPKYTFLYTYGIKDKIKADTCDRNDVSDPKISAGLKMLSCRINGNA